MIVIDFIMRNQMMIGMLGSLCLFVPWKKRRKLFALRAACSVAAAMCLSIFAPIPPPLNFLAYFAAIVAVVWACFGCGAKHILFSATCAYCVQHMTSKTAYLAMTLVMMHNYAMRYNAPQLGITMLIVANILVCIPIYFAGTRRVLRARELKFDSLKTLIYTSVFLLAAVFLSYYTENALMKGSTLLEEGYISLNAFCALFAFIILLMNFMNCRGERLAEEKRILEQLLKKDRLQYEQAKENMERINIRYHDIKQQRALAMDAEESAKLDSEIKSFKTLYYTGNKAVDITLAEKASVCVEEGIQFICSADGSCMDAIKPYHIYSLLGNAIDNAVESLRPVPDPDKKVIRLDIFRRKNMSVIRIGNYTDSMPKLENGMPVTTKADAENHGYGMKSMKNIAEEYGGMIYVDIEDHEFTLVVTVPTADRRIE